MTADELIEKLRELDAGQHLEVHISDESAEEDEDGLCADFQVTHGWIGDDEPRKVVILIRAWDFD